MAGDIESEEYYSVTDKICSILSHFKNECLEKKPTVLEGSLQLGDSSYSVDSQSEVETEWDIEQSKKLLIDSLAKKMPRNYANLIVANFQMKEKGFLETSKVIKPLVSKVHDTTLIDKIMSEQEFIYSNYQWPPHKLVHDKTVQVTRCGRICEGGLKVSVSGAFAGQEVGIKEVEDGIWVVTFLDYDLGYFDQNNSRIEPVEDPFNKKVLPMSPV